MSETPARRAADPGGEPAAQRVPALGELGAVVHQRIMRLQATLGTSSGTSATVALLRRAVGKPPGSDPQLWEWTIGGIPGRATSDEPTPEEWAAHTAMTLWALHQQSRPEPMHHRGVGVGEAVRRLGTRASAPAVRRRFEAVATSATVEEAVHHLRGLISQLRAERIALDYGRLADDLNRFQRPGGAKVVRLRWGRQYYRLGGIGTANESSDAPDGPTAVPDAE